MPSKYHHQKYLFTVALWAPQDTCVRNFLLYK